MLDCLEKIKELFTEKKYATTTDSLHSYFGSMLGQCARPKILFNASYRTLAHCTIPKAIEKLEDPCLRHFKHHFDVAGALSEFFFGNFDTYARLGRCFHNFDGIM